MNVSSVKRCQIGNYHAAKTLGHRTAQKLRIMQWLVNTIRHWHLACALVGIVTPSSRLANLLNVSVPKF